MSRALGAFRALASPWDRRAGAGGAALTVALTGLAVLLTAATDEGVTWSERVARAMPLVPACAALATGLSMQGGERRGERRALEALGRSPSSTRSAAALGALAVGIVAALVVLLDSRLSLSPFFPRVHTSGGFTFDGGTFASVRAGFRVMADGSISLPAEPGAPLTSMGDAGEPERLSLRVSAALFVAITSAAFVATLVAAPRFPAFSAAPRPQRSHAGLRGPVALILVTGAVSMLCLQAAAAGRLPALAGPAPSAVLLALAVTILLRSGWA